MSGTAALWATIVGWKSRHPRRADEYPDHKRGRDGWFAYANIVVPAVVFRAPGMLDAGWTNPKVVAALAAAAVAWRWRSVTATMAAGMVALWLAQWALRTWVI